MNATLNALFRNSIAVEVSCEPNLSCDTDMLSFKAFLIRSMAATTKMAAFTTAEIMPALTVSAAAAALQCSGGTNGRMCGQTWPNGSRWDGTQGAGQLMAALEVVLSNMISVMNPPVTNATGGTSLGDPNAGAKKPAIIPPYLLALPSTGDIAGAGILTIIVVAGMMSLFIWICIRETESENN